MTADILLLHTLRLTIGWCSESALEAVTELLREAGISDR